MKVFGHRGFCGLYPENSLIGFEKAIDLGVDFIEMDVVISKDFQVVVSHDPVMAHDICLNPNGITISKESENLHRLFDMDYAAIKAYDCGSLPHPHFPNQEKLAIYKPLLSEVIAMAEQQSNRAIGYNIELKSSPAGDGVLHPAPKTFAALVLEQLKSIAQRTIISSFDVRVLNEIHLQNANISIGLLIDEDEEAYEKLQLLYFKPAHIISHYSNLGQILIESLQKQDFTVMVWTVNEWEDIQKFIQWGVDGIISDYPDRVME